MSPRAPGFHYAAFGLSCAYALLVFCQLSYPTGPYASDLLPHVDFVLHPGQNAASNYSLFHSLCGWMLDAAGLVRESAQPFAGAAILVLLVAAFYGSLMAVHTFFKRAYPGRDEWLLGGCSLAVFLVSMIILQPLLAHTRYLGVFTPNPWHNPTYVFGRFFSILAFCQFVRLLGPQERATPGRLLAFAVFTALSVWGKPSFLIGFLPAALAVLGWGWLGGTIGPGRALRVAATLLPAVLVLAWIDHKIFAGGGTGDKVILAPGAGWGRYTTSFPLSIALGMLFPLYVVIVRLRRLSPLMLIASATWVASCAAFLLLAESGNRAGHANFAWCYMSGMFFMHLGAIGEWFLGPAGGEHRLLRWTGTALFWLHLLSGLRYFLTILGGGSYG